jgi:hypothetical protein
MLAVTCIELWLPGDGWSVGVATVETAAANRRKALSLTDG